jgi:PAS domain S-box-containing protein
MGCTFFNDSWLAFTGRTLEQELGNGWAAGVHPDDLARCLDVYRSAFLARREFHIQYRLRRRDGEYRWVLDIGAPEWEAEGRFLGYVGSCVDVTEARRRRRGDARDGWARTLSTLGDPAISLTQREREVVALLARGLTNRQIAAALVISVSTVRVHVDHIFAKLGLHSRSQVAVWAARHRRRRKGENISA